MSGAQQPLLECVLSVEFKMQLLVYGVSLFSIGVGLNLHFAFSQPQITQFDQEGQFFNNSIFSNNSGLENDEDNSSSIHFRLPTSVVPSHYTLKVIHHLNITNSSSDHVEFSAPGDVWIQVVVLQEVDNITLHADDIEILDIKITNASNIQMLIEERTLEKDTQFLVMRLSTPIPSGEYTIHISFLSRIADDRLNGLYLDYYMIPETGVRRYLATTLFAPNHARKAFPCFDEPGLRATFEITVGHPLEYMSLSNTSPVNSSDPVEGHPGYVWTSFQKTPPMSTYIVAMITCDFEDQTSYLKEGELFPIKLKMYAPHHLLRYSSSPNYLATNFSLKMTERLIPWMEGEFGQDFPLSKLDAVSLPHFYFSAMENWGLLTFKDPVLLTIPNVTTEKEQARVAEVLAHELGHQTFGNLVTISWWDDVWLKEGFSTFYSDQAINVVHPDFHTLIHFTTHNLQVALHFDAGLETHPLHNSPKTPSDVGDIYTRIPYKKGASILRMTEAFMTPELFRRGVNLYLDRKKYKAASQDDLFEAFETVELNQQHLQPTSWSGSSVTISDILRSWTMQSGFPLIRVSIEPDGFLRITQEKFTNPHIEPLLNDLNGSELRKNRNASWWVPLTFWPPMLLNNNNNSSPLSRPGAHQVDIWLPKGQDEIFVDHIPLVLNPHAIGYYRVMYDAIMLDRIQQKLCSNHSTLFPVTRSQLIDDYFALSFARYLNISEALKLTRYLDVESQLVVWTSALANFDRIYYRLRDTDHLPHFQEYVLSKLNPAWNTSRNGLNDTEDITEKKRLYALLLKNICLYQPSKCAQLSAEKMNGWRNHNQPIPPDEQEIIFCAYVATASNETEAMERSNFLQEQYHHESFSVMKSRYLKALSCATYATIISRLLNWTTNIEVHDVERVQIIKFVAETPLGKTLVLPFLRENFSSLHKNASVANPVTEGIKALIPYFTTKAELLQLKDFVHNFGEQLGPGKRKSLKRELKKVHINILWTNEIMPDVVAWFAREVSFGRSDNDS